MVYLIKLKLDMLDHKNNTFRNTAFLIFADVSLKHVIREKTKMKWKEWENIFHMIVKANSIVQYVIQIKNGIIKHVNMKKVIVGILAHVFVRTVSI